MPPLTSADALTTWQFSPAVSPALALLAAGYLAGVLAVRRRHRLHRWPLVRTLAFLGGLVVIAVALEGGVAVYDDVLFRAHMVQHLLLIMVAPPLLIAGRPVTLLLHATRGRAHLRIRRAVRSRAAFWLTWPPFAVTLYAAVVAVTHLTPLMTLVLENSWVHEAEHVLYLAAGYLYFLPVVGSEPVRWRLPVFGRYLLLLFTMPVDTVVGVILMLTPHELFPAYLSSGASAADAVADLHGGGLIMFAGSDLIMFALAMILAVGLVRERPGERLPADAGDLDAYNAYLVSLERGS